MRVLHVIGGSGFGGGSILILEMAAMSLPDGWSSSILTTNDEMIRIAAERSIAVVPLDCIRSPINPIHDLPGLARLTRHLRANRYDIVHTHTSKAGWMGRLAARLARVPAIVHTVHGFAFHEASSARTIAVYSALERLAARWCDRIVTVSEFHRDWAIRLRIAPSEKLVAIPNGIPPSRVAPERPRSEVRASWGVPTDACVVLTPGRLAPQKGLETLIEAVPRILAAGARKPVFVLAGEGPLRGELEGMARRLGVAEHVRLVGHQTDMGGVLAASDIVALPSIREGLSIALLESMAAERPIVATSIGSNIEVLRDGQSGIIVAPGDCVQLGAAIVSLVNDGPAAARMAAEARRMYEERYTLSRMLSSYRALYFELTAQPQVRTP